MLAGLGGKMGNAGALMMSLRKSALEGVTPMDGKSIVSTSKSIADLCGVLAIDHGEASTPSPSALSWTLHAGSRDTSLIAMKTLHFVWWAIVWAPRLLPAS